MGSLLEIHLGFAFFVLLVSLFIGWVQLGRRVVVTVIGIQILIGAVAALMGLLSHTPLSSTLWIHILGALAAMAAYIAGRRIVARDEARYRVVGWALSLAGLVLIVLSIWYGVAPYRVQSM